MRQNARLFVGCNCKSTTGTFHAQKQSLYKWENRRQPVHATETPARNVSERGGLRKGAKGEI
ncbi:hypothetical protein SAY87_000103 [Trapa incisa]|uniref:Uncharacterized protein n=1 Tax=Trapa incisa TaxID=236973 RepID=A0AAN7JGD0_9MYRT|nr:hypothetical protein SAY87_000103 [Trapa incisa]